MRIDARWLAILAILVMVAAAYIWIAWGLSGAYWVVLLLALVLGVLGPIVAAVRVGIDARRSAPFRGRLPVILAVPATAGLLTGCFGYDDGFSTFALVLVIFSIPVLTP